MIDSLIILLVGAGVGGLWRLLQWSRSGLTPTEKPISLPPAKRPREIIETPKGFEIDRPC